MKKYLIAATAVAAFSLAGAGTATSAFAGQHTTTAPQAAQTVQAAKCKWTGIAKENIKLRKKPTTKSAGLRLVYKKTKVCSNEWTNVKGGKYTKCGHTSTDWERITYRGTRGWIPTYCVKW